MPEKPIEESKAVCPLLGRTCLGEDQCAPAMIAFNSALSGKPMCPIVALVGSVHFLAMSFSAESIEEDTGQEEPQPLTLLSRKQAIENLGNSDIIAEENQQEEQPE